ncbi:hypothetical protein PUU40_004258 [Salmonella enterica]|nr:hypothetical protein [Salmonella enterica]
MAWALSPNAELTEPSALELAPTEVEYPPEAFAILPGPPIAIGEPVPVAKPFTSYPEALLLVTHITDNNIIEILFNLNDGVFFQIHELYTSNLIIKIKIPYQAEQRT